MHVYESEDVCNSNWFKGGISDSDGAGPFVVGAVDVIDRRGRCSRVNSNSELMCVTLEGEREVPTEGIGSCERDKIRIRSRGETGPVDDWFLLGTACYAMPRRCGGVRRRWWGRRRRSRSFLSLPALLATLGFKATGVMFPWYLMMGLDLGMLYRARRVADHSPCPDLLIPLKNAPRAPIFLELMYDASIVGLIIAKSWKDRSLNGMRGRGRNLQTVTVRTRITNFEDQLALKLVNAHNTQTSLTPSTVRQNVGPFLPTWMINTQHYSSGDIDKAVIGDLGELAPSHESQGIELVEFHHRGDGFNSQL
ncbi:hypothetical protein JB92DRAFT_2831528 [Gautieria morchelliformis]|nr:hypothetical protein JB92DRAFT_2831528 [Gautieria morchelliformis]